MAVQFANQFTLVGTPTYCAACFNQDPSVRHVDMDAASERGWSQDHSVTMDDLILCETCVRSAAALVGMLDEKTIETELERYRATDQRIRSQRDRWKAYANDLEQTLAERPERTRTIRRPQIGEDA